MVVSAELLVVTGVAAIGLVILGVFLGRLGRAPRQENAGRDVDLVVDGTSATRSAPRFESADDAGTGQGRGLAGGGSAEPLALPDGCIETKILYVHDDPKGYRALAKELRRYCIELAGASDADTAYLACFSEEPKLVLVDAELPNNHAEEVLKRMKEHPLAKDIHTIVVTQREALHQQRTLEGRPYLAKPIDVDQLLGELTRRAALCDLAPDCANHPDRRAGAGPVPVKGTGGSEPDIAKVTKPASQAPAGEAVTEGGTASKRRPRVLCIDDDPHVSQAIMMRLRPLGVDVIRAFDGMQGFWAGLDSRPDVIITDMRMPDGEGNYIFNRFQSHPLTKDVPVIVLTGETNPAVRRTMLSLGAAAYFTKPWNFDELRQELERHIDLCGVEAKEPVAATT